MTPETGASMIVDRGESALLPDPDITQVSTENRTVNVWVDSGEATSITSSILCIGLSGQGDFVHRLVRA
eukprot:3244299-Rhodomonas_salina.1